MSIKKIPWNNHAEYEALHDKRECYVDFGGVTVTSCPYNGGQRTDCEGMIVVNGRHPESCPRFGGCDISRLSDTGGKTTALCKSSRYFEAMGQPAPTRVGKFWPPS